MRQATLAKGTTIGLAWFSNPTLLLCVAGVLLPNALSVGALLAGIGSPPRTAAIFAYAALALAARIAKPTIVAALYLAIAAYDTVSTVALLFNLAPSEVGLALNLTAELKLFHSPLYIALVLGLAALVIANITFLIWKRDTLRRGNPAVMALIAFAFGAADLLANTSPHYQFGTLYGANKPMESAGEESGFRRTVLAAKPRNALMVMVEAMGHFADPAKQAILLQSFRDANLLKRYDVKIGTTTYYGSTTHAEMRELCNTRQSYLDVLRDDTIVCLPELLDDRGYQTVSLHNFTSAFFGRHDWYPKLGFEKRIFGQDVIDSMQRLCGGPFRGPCDVDLIPMIGKQLREAKQPTFFYWMTLSTHVPVAPREGTPRLGCENHGGAVGHVEVCHMTEMWLDLFDGLARMAVNAPLMEILIVGDHAPPLWSKAGRELFTPGKVTWIRLTPRGNARNGRVQ